MSVVSLRVDSNQEVSQMSMIEITVPVSEEASVEESRHAMAQLIRDRLGISREEFLAAVDAGEFESTEDPETLRLLTLVPFAR